EGIDVGERAARLVDDLLLADAEEGILDLLVHCVAEGRRPACVAVEHDGSRPFGGGHLEVPVAQEHPERRKVISHVTLPLCRAERGPAVWTFRESNAGQNSRFFAS